MELHGKNLKRPKEGERKKLQQQVLATPRPDLNIGVNRPWQIGRGKGVGDKVEVSTLKLAAKAIKEAKRPLLVLGPLLLELEFEGKRAIDYAIDLAKVADMPVVATGHVLKALLERGFKPDAYMPIVNIIDRLKDPRWNGIRGKGQHDVVAFFGIDPTMASQGLSTLKHFAPHLKTITLCPIYYPTADMPLISPPHMSHGRKLTRLIEALKG